MLTAHEKAQLVNEYRRDQRCAVGVLLACAAGLLVVVVVALVGMDIHKIDNNGTPRHSAAQSR